MTDVQFMWNEGPGGNVEHLALNNLTPEDVVHAYHTVLEFTVSRSSGRPAYYGDALDRRLIFVVYEEIAADTLYVITAYEV